MPWRACRRRYASTSFSKLSAFSGFLSFRMTVVGKNHAGSHRSSQERTSGGIHDDSQRARGTGGTCRRKTWRFTQTRFAGAWKRRKP